MRCVSCNESLSDFESSRKDSGGKYLDLCNPCYGTIADDLTGVVVNDLLLPVIEDNDDFSDLPDNLTDDDLFNEDDSRS